MPIYKGTANAIDVSLQELVDNPALALAQLSPLALGQARVRSTIALPLFQARGTIIGGDFEVNAASDTPPAPYRLLVRQNFGSQAFPVFAPVFRSNDLKPGGQQVVIAYRVCDDADLAWLESKGMRTTFTYAEFNALLAPIRQEAGLKTLRASEEDGRVRISFEKEIRGPNIKGKILLEGRPSESYFLERLIRVDIEDVDFFGLASLAELVIGDLIDDAETALNDALATRGADLLGQLPDEFTKHGITITATEVSEGNAGVTIRPSVGMIVF